MPKSSDSTSHARSSQLLEQHRRDIEALDRRILHLVCERLELARQIGALKREQGIPLRNFELEAQVRRRFADASSDLGLDPTLGQDLALFLIRKAVEEQAWLLDTRSRGNSLHALVVGGKGGMGHWIACFVHGQGHRVSVYDPAPGTSPFPEVSDLGEGAADADLILVSVPMSVCKGVLEQLAELAPSGVVAEMCSLKSHLVPVMERVRSSGLRLVSFHPMFGPGVRMLSGRTVVLCTEGQPQDVAVVRGLFEGTSARLVDLDIAEHDRRMALVLGLTHLSNLVLARALSLSGISASALGEVAGVTFAKQLATTVEVTAENPELYYEIQALNPSTSDTGRWLMGAAQDFLFAAAAGESERFESLMTGAREYLAAAAEPAAAIPTAEQVVSFP